MLPRIPQNPNLRRPGLRRRIGVQGGLAADLRRAAPIVSMPTIVMTPVVAFSHDLHVPARCPGSGTTLRAQGSGDAYRDQTVIKQRRNLLPIKAAKFVTSDGKPKLRLRMRCGCSGPKSGQPIFHLGSSSHGRCGDGVAARHVRLKSLGCGHPQLP